MVYDIESQRGMDDREDHYNPGIFWIKIDKKTKFNILACGGSHAKKTFDRYYTEDPTKFDLIYQKQLDRLRELNKKMSFLCDVKEEPSNKIIKALVHASDSFIVERNSASSKTIIAGYHWFTDWGRDALVALPGLTLVTRRFDCARDILSTLSLYCKDGLIPNYFSDDGKPIYNSADASLWFFYAVYKYLEYTNDFDWVGKKLFQTMKDIIFNYTKGTHFNISMDEDGLINAGDKNIQLTWMDAKIGDFIVTPRHGKAVEINALWYNALKTMELVCKELREDNTFYREKHRLVRNSFNEKFWNEEKGCLYDVIRESYVDFSIRPNQIFAISLPFTLLDKEREKSVIITVMKELLTPYGLRTLSPSDKNYKGTCTGNQLERDTAYHQGTVWNWLLGHFITAFVKVNNYSEESREYAKKFFFNPLADHLKDAGIGTVSEIFDGDFPNKPRGCISQAWSVGEMLRSFMEDIMGVKPRYG